MVAGCDARACAHFVAKVLLFYEISKKTHKKCIFFQKYLVISKKSSTFAAAFDEETLGCYRLVA